MGINKKGSELSNFLKNIFYFGIGSFGTSFISLLMLPLITSTYTVMEYGKYDLSFTIASIVSIFIVFGLQDGLFRFMFSNKYTKEEVLSNTLSLILINGLIISLIYVAFFNTFFKETFSSNFIMFMVLIFLLIIVNTFQSFFLSFLRVENKSKKVVILSFSQSLLFVCLFFGLSIFYNLPVYSLLISQILASFLSYAFVYKEVRKTIKLFHFKMKRNLTIDLIKFSGPLIIVFSGYWVLSSSDKFLINHYLSVRELGLYSAATKIGGLLNILQTVFGSAWQYFSYETMNNIDKEKIYSMFLDIIITLSSYVIIFIILFSDFITLILFSKPYYEIWFIIPILCFSPVFMVLMWILSVGSKFVNKTYLSLISVGAGALINIILNIIFIPLYGIVAAALTTLISYFSMVIISYFLNRKIINIQINLLLSLLVILMILIAYLVKLFWLELSLIGSIFLFLIFSLLFLLKVKKDLNEYFN